MGRGENVRAEHDALLEQEHDHLPAIRIPSELPESKRVLDRAQLFVDNRSNCMGITRRCAAADVCPIPCTEELEKGAAGMEHCVRAKKMKRRAIQERIVDQRKKESFFLRPATAVIDQPHAMLNPSHSRPARTTSTRDLQLYSRHIHTVHGVAIRLSAANKRKALIEAHLSSLLCRRAAAARRSADPTGGAQTAAVQASSDRRRAQRADDQPPGPPPPPPPHSAAGTPHYWRETANTLSRENAAITEQLGRLRADNAQLRESLRRLTAAHKETEQALAESSKELAHLSLVSRHWGATGGQATFVPLRTRIPPVPVDPQGKDAMHWYLSCRHMEAQFNLLRAELENKISELTEIISANKRKRDAGGAT